MLDIKENTKKSKMKNYTCLCYKSHAPNKYAKANRNLIIIRIIVFLLSIITKHALECNTHNKLIIMMRERRAKVKAILEDRYSKICIQVEVVFLYYIVRKPKFHHVLYKTNKRKSYGREMIL